MKQIDMFHMIVYSWFGLSAVVFFYLVFISAPYGRHERAGWGPHIRDKPGWVLMEIPAVVVFGLLFVFGAHTRSAVAIAFLFLWEFHYVYRTFIFSALLRGNETLPLVIVGLGFFFNIVNSYINGRYLFTLCPEYPIGWFFDPRFLIGLSIFCAGFTIHSTSDRILRNLRRPGETEFKIPQGGLFRWISCPNYLGEMLEWCGWAIATWSLPGLAFFVWTVANLLPRTLSHHRWYRQTFRDYPNERRAIIPFVL